MRGRVLIVDDDPDYRLLLRLALEGHDTLKVVGEASDADEAAVVAAREQPDVALVDVVLPGVDGLTALPRIRAAAPGALVILMSGLPPEELHRPLEQAGAIGQISKRVPPSRLPEEIIALASMLQVVDDAIQAATTHLPADLISARQARQFVDEALTRWDCADVGSTIALLVTELVANAVKHAASPADVSVRLLDDALRVEVVDSSPELPKRRLASQESTSGRGLALVEDLATSWGIDLVPDGKRVWFEVPRPDLKADE